jgi:hypothetical protein
VKEKILYLKADALPALTVGGASATRRRHDFK